MKDEERDADFWLVQGASHSKKPVVCGKPGSLDFHAKNAQSAAGEK